MELSEVLAQIDSQMAEVNSLRPLAPDTEQRIMQKFRLDWNYHSNNIEGNSLTYGETKTFLLHGITAEGKTLKDHLDIKGHNEAILLLNDVLKEERPLTESFIRELHKIILHEPYDRPALTPDGLPTTKRINIGQYKTSPNHVKTATGEMFYFATPEETPAKMHDLMNWYSSESAKGELHPLIISAEFHYRFIVIHPFDDGNGRMARILMNLILMKFGYPPVIIKTQEKKDYYRALRSADGGDIAYFVKYIGEQLLHSLSLYIKGAKGESIEDLDDVDKQIALLMARLEDGKPQVVYNRETSMNIFEESLRPLLEVAFSKLNKFNALFEDYKIILEGSSSSESDDFFEELEKYDIEDTNIDVVRELGSFFDDAFLDSVTITYDWIDFLKKPNATFNSNLKFQIMINRFDCEILIINKSETIKFKKHYKNLQDTSFNQEAATALATQVLRQIEANLAQS